MKIYTLIDENKNYNEIYKSEFAAENAALNINSCRENNKFIAIQEVEVSDKALLQLFLSHQMFTPAETLYRFQMLYRDDVLNLIKNKEECVMFLEKIGIIDL